MSLRSERQVVQKPLVRYAIEAGWRYLAPEKALGLRGSDASPTLDAIFVERVRALNPGVLDRTGAQELLKRLQRVAPNIEGNLQAWEFLLGLKTVFVPREKRERNVRLLDLDHPANNIFHVTDEFSFSNGVHTIRADVAFLINGVPVILVETKAATKLEGVAESLDQVQRYHREGPELLALIQVFGLTHLVRYFYGPTWNASHKNLYNWKEESAGKDFEALVKTFVAPDRVLRVLRDFILFTRKEDELQKVILRPHQMRAVDRALSRAGDPAKRRGLIWHTQGSGKTYTMITIARRLMEQPVFANPTVLMLVDRTELEAQLSGNLAATLVGGAGQPVDRPGRYTQTGNLFVVESKRGLLELLRNDTRGLIVSMIHKFDDIPANVITRSNVFVLVDEAHRTTGGDLGNYLMGALPNATYLGFTGTPIDKTVYGKGTFKVFGTDDPQGYLDKYSIAESIEDGATVKLYYSLAPNDLRVDRETLEKEFLSLAEAEGVSDIEELNRVLDRAVNLKNMLKAQTRVSKVAAYVAKHFTESVEPMGYKAFLVGVDREACRLLKEALDNHLPPEYSRVVISQSPGDREELQRHHLSEDDEKAVRKAFVKPGQLPKILIVTEKLLTGYDAPVLYCMYLDKPMRDHVLLQAIARVNRPYEDEKGMHKPGGLVVDFVGIFENLEKALAFDSRDVEGVIESLSLLKARFKVLMARARRDYLPLGGGKAADKAAEAVLEAFFVDETRQEFYSFFQELEDLYEIISPDPFLRDFLDDYQRAADIYNLLHAAYDQKSLAARELAKKTARLVRENTQAGAISDAMSVYEINEQTLDVIARSGDPDTVKVFNLIKSVQLKIDTEAGAAPYLTPIGERAEAIIEAYRQRQVDTGEALKRLADLVREINEAQREQAARRIAGEPFAVFWFLKQSGVAVDDAEKAARTFAELLKKYPHWKTSEHQAREMRNEVYDVLIDIRVSNIAEAVDRLMTLIRARPQ
ncbi:MAG: HsdR family type I site-specific deoxyribonuclease [Chloroflexi bacterium]|nr:HsdR family type I site-specific deoxyribonuclease [Chloroflexota bacterium]